MKKRRGSVLWRWTWYMAQPGSLRDSWVNFENSCAVSVSRPVFAIQITASTTILFLPNAMIRKLYEHKVSRLRETLRVSTPLEMTELRFSSAVKTSSKFHDECGVFLYAPA